MNFTTNLFHKASILSINKFQWMQCVRSYSSANSLMGRLFQRRCKLSLSICRVGLLLPEIVYNPVNYYYILTSFLNRFIKLFPYEAPMEEAKYQAKKIQMPVGGNFAHVDRTGPQIEKGAEKKILQVTFFSVQCSH